MADREQFRNISADIDGYMADPVVRSEVEGARAEMAALDAELLAGLQNIREGKSEPAPPWLLELAGEPDDPVYTVHAFYDGEWWNLWALEVPGAISQTRVLLWADEAIREAIAWVLDVPPNSFWVEIIEVAAPKP